MSALERLRLIVYAYNDSQWDDVHIIREKQLQALTEAATTCPKLRYARITMGAKALMSAPMVSATIRGLTCSWKIVRERRPGSNELKPVFKVLDAGADKLLRAQSMWTPTEKTAQYVKENLDELIYDKPLWME